MRIEPLLLNLVHFCTRRAASFCRLDHLGEGLALDCCATETRYAIGTSLCVASKANYAPDELMVQNVHS